jgi:hypothetical protein
VTSLSLSRSLKEGRLSEFVLQEEGRGIGPIDRAEFDGAVYAITGPLPKDRTSRSASGGNSSGKRTRLGIGPDASS